MTKIKALLVSAILSTMVLSACGAENDTQIIKVANYFASDHSQNIALREVFKPMVEENSNGQLTVQIYDNNQLGDEQAFTDSVRMGTVEMGIAGMALQSTNPMIGAVEWPFLFESYEQANEILNGPIGDQIGDAFRELNVEPLTWTANGFRVVSSDRPIDEMDDFRGFRLRMPNVPIFLDVGDALGANVQSLSISEVFTALEQGVINGQENPYATLVQSAWYEVQSHVLETYHMFSPNVYLMNLHFWDNLDPELQEIVSEAAQEASQYQWELAIQSEIEMKEYLESEGIEIIVPSDEFRQQLVDAMDPVYEKRFEQYDWAEEFINSIRNYESE
ncbi:TRAP transporter substrate-binding protein [Halalkalibacter okhensis]|uniref:C4-dicarboxylate ABC transporter substrate-binding protein n=1 Tax=Halalkalibacter okhensis TaxID=333138 RepID=A0A0B0ICE0_9BACI|nr:TRAP transporter substrate-binding protein [Halalkalibacter okhensis]KHF38945.1 C4-dicarboxylate ABC transporter substrate-binding protein [Halalkalibacter okhensis]